MSDIVERLKSRTRQVYDNIERDWSDVKDEEAEEAAKEITRLRAELKDRDEIIASCDKQIGQWVNGEKHEVLQDAINAVMRENMSLKARAEAAEARLREVLDRESATTARYDAKLDALEARLTEAVEVLRKIESGSLLGIVDLVLADNWHEVVTLMQSTVRAFLAKETQP